MKYKIHTLKNGLRVVLAPQPEAVTTTVMVLTGTGSRHENGQNNGVSHFLEHMLFKGTTKRPTAKVLAEELDGMGSEHNAFTSKDHTAYYAKVSSEHVPQALDIISDIFLNAKIDARELNKERGAIIEEINMYEDLPMRSIHDEFETLMFGADTPLGRTILGPKENIKKLKRKDLQDYIKQNYTPDNTVVCVAGKFVQSTVLKEAKKHFIKKLSTPRTKFRGQTPYQTLKQGFDVEQGEAKVAIKYKDTDQTHLVLGVPAYERGHKDEYVLHILNTILGGGMSSRLWSEVREKRGLAYYVGSSVQLYSDTGYIAARAGVTHANLEKAIKIILKEMMKLKTNPPSAHSGGGGVEAAELKKAKSQLKGNLALALDTSDAVANYLAASTVLRGGVTLPNEISKKIDKVKASDIQRVAREIFATSKLNLAVVGPHKNEKELLNLLKV